MNHKTNTMKFSKHFYLSFTLTLLLSACATAPHDKYTAGKSYLQQPLSQQISDSNNTQNQEKDEATQANQSSQGLSYLPSLLSAKTDQKTLINLTEKFSDTKMLQLTTDSLPLQDYLHYVLGDLLGVSYILGEQLKADKKSVTLNLQNNITERKLFTLSEEILTERGYVIRYEQDIYYIHKQESASAQGDVVYGYGKQVSDVPNTSLEIIQMIPYEFGIQIRLNNILTTIAKVKLTVDAAHNSLIVRGKRREIIKAVEFMALMDQPGFKNRHIATYKTTFVSTDDIKTNLPILMKQEGLSVATDSQSNMAVSIVTLERTGTVVFFANSRAVLERVNFWLKQIDQPADGNKLQYFLYQPQFARATDLGESLNVLIGGGSSQTSTGDSTSASSQNKKSTTNKNRNAGNSSNSSGMSLVVDERANALIFKSTGDSYRELLPLIKRLDVMPKQVILEVLIAEVKLTDAFKQGVEFALSNVGGTVQGGYTAAAGSAGLNYILSGTKGSLTIDLLQSNGDVRVLSRPTLVVRDGVTASIRVGDDIPTVGEIISDPVNGNRTSVVYRKTGVDLKVTPTINAQGVVIMEIEQSISNQALGGESVAGSPIIFERSISTEVVAESGQTIVLGGLISESRNSNKRSVPFFSSIPLIGHLFNGNDNSSDKTELVVLVTPKIIESSEEWDDIKSKFRNSLSELTFN